MRGTLQFDAKFAETFSAEIAKIKSRKPTCDGTQELTSYQEAAVLACTVLDRLLVVHATGSGKTRAMHGVLDNKLGDIRPKVILVPDEPIKANFYSQVKRGDTNLAKFAKLNENEDTEITLNLTGSSLNDYKTAVEHYKRGIDRRMGYNAPLRASTFNDAYNLTKLTCSLSEALLKMASKQACFAAPPEKDTIFKPAYGLSKDKQVGHNPFNNKIVVVDEAHRLLENTKQNDILLEALRTADNAQIYFFTATPVDEKNLAVPNALLAVIKNTPFLNPSAEQQTLQASSSNHGYISFYYNFDEPFYPRTIPYLNVLHTPPDEPLSNVVVARIVFTELYGPNLKTYIKFHTEFLRKQNDKHIKAATALKTTSLYSDGQAARHVPSKLQYGTAAFFSKFNKFDCLIEHLTNETLKTVVLFTTGGLVAFQTFLERQHSDKLFTPEVGISRNVHQPQVGASLFKIGFLRDKRDKRRNETVLTAFNKSDNLTGTKLTVLCITEEFGTGVDFHAVRRIILTGPPQSASSYFQYIGRGLRMCKHFSLPPSERTMKVEMLVATFDANRTLGDLEQQEQQLHQQDLTVDEIMLVELRNDILLYRARMAEFSKDAIDKTWYHSEWASNLTSSDDLETVCRKRDESNQTDALSFTIQPPGQLLPDDAQTLPTSTTYPNTTNTTNNNNYNNNYNNYNPDDVACKDEVTTTEMANQHAVMSNFKNFQSAFQHFERFVQHSCVSYSKETGKLVFDFDGMLGWLVSNVFNGLTSLKVEMDELLVRYVDDDACAAALGVVKASVQQDELPLDMQKAIQTAVLARGVQRCLREFSQVLVVLASSIAKVSKTALLWPFVSVLLEDDFLGGARAAHVLAIDTLLRHMVDPREFGFVNPAYKHVNLSEAKRSSLKTTKQKASTLSKYMSDFAKDHLAAQALYIVRCALSQLLFFCSFCSFCTLELCFIVLFKLAQACPT